MLALGIDIGGTKIAVALVSARGEIIAETRVPTRAHDGTEQLITRAAQSARQLIDTAPGPVIGVGVGCPGYIDAARGVVLHAVNLGWRNMPLADALREGIGGGLAVHVRHDVSALAYGERFFGAGQGVDDFALIAAGTGIGFAAFSGGRMVTGSGWGGMELGHISLVPNGRACGCGLRGCAEMYASGVGLEAAMREYLPQYPRSTLHQSAGDTAALLAAYDAGDALAVRVVDEAGAMLGTLAVIMAGTLNPRKILLGGGLGAALYDRVIDRIYHELRTRTTPIAHQHLEIARAAVTSSAAGAAAVALTMHSQNITA